MCPLRQPDNLTVLPQTIHSPSQTIYTFSLLQYLPPPPLSSLSVDDLAFYLEKMKAIRREPQQTPHHLSYPPSRPFIHILALYPCSCLKQYSFLCALDLVYPISPISLIFLSLLNHSQGLANTLLLLAIFKIKRNFLTPPQLPFPLLPCSCFLQKLLKNCLYSLFQFLQFLFAVVQSGPTFL